MKPMPDEIESTDKSGPFLVILLGCAALWFIAVGMIIFY